MGDEIRCRERVGERVGGDRGGYYQVIGPSSKHQSILHPSPTASLTHTPDNTGIVCESIEPVGLYLEQLSLYLSSEAEHDLEHDPAGPERRPLY